MKPLLLAALAALTLLVGCTSPQPQPLSSAPARVSFDAVATLATNACEAIVAPDYTAVIVARRKALRELQAGRIGPDEAQRVQAKADEARALLDRACPGGVLDSTALNAARRLRAELQ